MWFILILMLITDTIHINDEKYFKINLFLLGYVVSDIYDNIIILVRILINFIY